MFFKSHDGLGQDQEMVRMRRRPLYLSLSIVAVILICLLAAFFLLKEGHGSLLVLADQPGAVVVLNGAAMPTPTGVLIKGLRADTYSVSVSKEGFIPEPASQIINLKKGGIVKLSFRLRPQPVPPSENPSPRPPEPSRKVSLNYPTETQGKSPLELTPLKQRSSPDLTIKSEAKLPEKDASTPPPESSSGSLRVTTLPDKGGIYIDEIFRGNGLVDLSDLKLGELVVRFSELDGYRTPEPQKVFLSADKPSAQVEGVYLPLVFISASLDGSGRAVMQKSALISGYIVGEEPPHPDPVKGPEIKYLEETHSFAWEMGYAFPNRNPPGQDFLEMTFELPERFDGVKPLELRLYGYASDKHYPFTASGRTGYDVVVNDRPAIQNGAPGTKLGQTGAGFDVAPIDSYLHAGKNTIRIQSAASSHCFYYLYKIVLL